MRNRDFNALTLRSRAQASAVNDATVRLSRRNAHARSAERHALAATGKDERARREGGKQEDDERNGCSCE